jgi:hypothetical protein
MGEKCITSRNKRLRNESWKTPVDHFKDIVPYHNFANTSPPTTASPILRRVPIRKYSANLSFSSGNLAIDFPVRISPTIEGDCTKMAVTTRNRSNHPMYIPRVLNLFRSFASLFDSSREVTSQIANQISSRENHHRIDNSRFENFVSRCWRPTDLGSYSAPAWPYQEPRQRDNGANVRCLINKKNEIQPNQFCIWKDGEKQPIPVLSPENRPVTLEEIVRNTNDPATRDQYISSLAARIRVLCGVEGIGKVA